MIRKHVSSRNAMLTEVVSGLITAGGKRLRPAFVVLSAKFGRYNRKKVLSMAAALEILHTATLVHDDIIDRSKLRRGRTTVSEKYGMDMAVYAGDFLYTKAVLMLSHGVPAERLEIVARAVKTICEGEVDQYQQRFTTDTSVTAYLKRISRKTAVLFGAACALGAYSGRCPRQTEKSLAKFGYYYGVAFQLRDDLNDFISDSAVSGKPIGGDIGEGIFTLPVIYAMKESSEIRKMIEGLRGEAESGKKAAGLSQISRMVREHGGIEKAAEMLDKYVDRGLRSLETLPDNEYGKVFESLIRRLRVRDL